MFSKNYEIVPDKSKNGTRFVFSHACVHLVRAGGCLVLASDEALEPRGDDQAAVAGKPAPAENNNI
nr:hypothetical protein [uncultured Pseudomonas sp.]